MRVSPCHASSVWNGGHRPSDGVPIVVMSIHMTLPDDRYLVRAELLPHLSADDNGSYHGRALPTLKVLHLASTEARNHGDSPRDLAVAIGSDSA